MTSGRGAGRVAGRSRGAADGRVRGASVRCRVAGRSVTERVVGDVVRGRGVAVGLGAASIRSLGGVAGSTRGRVAGPLVGSGTTAVVNSGGAPSTGRTRPGRVVGRAGSGVLRGWLMVSPPGRPRSPSASVAPVGR